MGRAWATAVVVAAVLGGVSCGGSDEPPAPLQQAAEGRMRALAAPPTADVTATTAALFAFAERALPSLFPGAQATRNLNGWSYRYYPSTGVYLAVIDWRVYVLGGPFGTEVVDVGEITQYVQTVPIANRPPSVTLAAPSPSSYTAPATIALNASAADPDGNLARVEFYAGLTKIGEDTVSPFSFTWSNVGVGNYTVLAVAVDSAGARTSSTSFTVTVTGNLPPSVAITSPANGSIHTVPTTINIAATAADDGSVTRVEFFAGATKLGEDLVPPYSFAWANPSTGSYSITARVTDNTGLTTTSNAISVTVNAPSGPFAPLYGHLTFTYRFGANYTDTVTFRPSDVDGSSIASFLTSSPSMAIACVINSPPIVGFSYLCLSRYSSGSTNNYLFNVNSGLITGRYNFCASSQSSAGCAADMLSNFDAALSGFVTPLGSSAMSSLQEAPDADWLKEQMKRRSARHSEARSGSNPSNEAAALAAQLERLVAEVAAQRSPALPAHRHQR